jgi:hypothetical protein
MLLSVTQLQSLLAIVSDEAKPLAQTAASFARVFPPPSQFLAGCALAAILQATAPPPPPPPPQQQQQQQAAGAQQQQAQVGGTQRVVCHYVLWELFREGGSVDAGAGAQGGPFFSVLLDALDPPPADVLERNFLVQLLAGAPPRD